MIRLLLLFIAVTFAAVANAAVIYDNGTPNQADGANISAFISADDFIINTGAVLTGVSFASSADLDPYQSQFSGAIGWGIFSSTGSLPSMLLFAGSDNAPYTDTGKQIDGTEEFEVQFTLSLVLQPGTYWLAIHEGPFGNPNDGTEIYWDTTGNQTGSVGAVTADLTGASGWFPNGLISDGADLSFQISGDLTPSPEPSSLCLMIIACFFLYSAFNKSLKFR